MGVMGYGKDGGYSINELEFGKKKTINKKKTKKTVTQSPDDVANFHQLVWANV